jgi:hypothetical protein
VLRHDACSSLVDVLLPVQTDMSISQKDCIPPLLPSNVSAHTTSKRPGIYGQIIYMAQLGNPAHAAKTWFDGGALKCDLIRNVILFVRHILRVFHIEKDSDLLRS